MLIGSEELITEEIVLGDPVFQERVNALGIEPARAFLYQDPYHRYWRILQALEQLSIAVSDARALDLGCLRPELASLLATHYQCEVVGIDQWEMLEAWEGKAPPMRFLCCNLEGDWHSPFAETEDDRFDLVFALEVIEHMIDPAAFLSRIKAVLRPGGHVVISTPNINCLRNRVMVPLGRYPSGMEYKNIIHHVRMFNVDALAEELREQGFQPVRVFGVNFLPYRGPMRSRVYRAISEKLGDWAPRLSPAICAISRLP